MTDQPFHTFTYWRDKKGLKRALREYYPQTLAADLRLKTALATIEMAEASINAIMQEKRDAEADTEG